MEDWNDDSKPYVRKCKFQILFLKIQFPTNKLSHFFKYINYFTVTSEELKNFDIKIQESARKGNFIIQFTIKINILYY